MRDLGTFIFRTYVSLTHVLLVPEREIEEEARELERTEKKSKADEERRASAMENTFQVTFILRCLSLA